MRPEKANFSLIPCVFPAIFFFYLENSIIVAILLDNNKIARHKDWFANLIFF